MSEAIFMIRVTFTQAVTIHEICITKSENIYTLVIFFKDFSTLRHTNKQMVTDRHTQALTYFLVERDEPWLEGKL